MKKERIFWGIFFIAAAVFLIVGQLGILEGVGIWSLLLTVFFAACQIKSVIHKNVTGVLFSIAFLCIVYAEPLHIEAITPWPVLGAALLGSIGVSFFYHPKRDWNPGRVHYEDHVESIETVEGEQLSFATSFAGSIKYVDSSDFKNADLRCSFGSMKMYFDNATIQGPDATIHLDVSFGGVELYFPKEWNVVNHIESVFGGVDEKNNHKAEGTTTVILTGKICFAGVEIIYS